MIGNWGNLKESLGVQWLNFIPNKISIQPEDWDTWLQRSLLYYIQSNIKVKLTLRIKYADIWELASPAVWNTSFMIQTKKQDPNQGSNDDDIDTNNAA